MLILFLYLQRLHGFKKKSLDYTDFKYSGLSSSWLQAAEWSAAWGSSSCTLVALIVNYQHINTTKLIQNVFYHNGDSKSFCESKLI